MRSGRTDPRVLLVTVALVVLGILLVLLRVRGHRGSLARAEDRTASVPPAAPLAIGRSDGGLQTDLAETGARQSVEPRPEVPNEASPSRLAVGASFGDGSPIRAALVVIARGRVVIRQGRTGANGMIELVCPREGWKGCELFLLQGNALLARRDLGEVGGDLSVMVPLRGVVRGRVLVHGRPPQGPVRLIVSAEERDALPPPCPDTLLHALTWMEQADPGPSTWTDPEGRFTFGGLAPNWSGTLALEYGLRLASGEQRVPLPAPRDDLVLELEEPYAVRGRVVTPGGKPARLCPLRVWYLARGAFEIHDDLADSEGRFLVPLRWDATGQGEITFLDPRHGTTKRTLPPLSSAGADLGTVVLEGGRPLVCTVRDEAGAPIPGAIASTPWRHSDPSGSDGICRLGLVPREELPVTVEAFGYLAEKRLLPALATHDGAEEERLDVTLRRAPLLEAHLLTPEGAFAEGARLEVRGEDPFDTDNGMPDIPQTRLGASPVQHRETITDEGGREVVRGVFVQTAHDPILVTSLKCSTPIELRVTDSSGREAGDSRWITFDAAERHVETFRLSEPLVTCSGIVLDEADRPVPDAEVRVVGPASARADAWTDRAGRFRFPSLLRRPLDVRVVWNDIPGPPTRILDPARESVLRQDRGRPHDLVVLDTQGNPLHPEYVGVLRDGERIAEGEIRADGSAHFEHLPSAPVVFRMTLQGRELETRAAPGPRTEFRVDASASLRVAWPYEVPSDARALMILVGPEESPLFDALEPRDVAAGETIIDSLLPGSYEVRWTLFRSGETPDLLAQSRVALASGEQASVSPPAAGD